MVTKDTVDEDVYAMQERKSKMNAAIMGSGEAPESDAVARSKEKKLLLRTAVDRFLRSPKGTVSGRENEVIYECDAI